jgi:hypothetical protein
MVEDYLKQKFYGCASVTEARARMESRVISGDISATEAAAELIRIFEAAKGRS